MKTFKNYLKEEVFYWYIVKGTSSKGKVSHVGTERQLKLKIRKPTFPKLHRQRICQVFGLDYIL